MNALALFCDRVDFLPSFADARVYIDFLLTETRLRHIYLMNN